MKDRGVVDYGSCTGRDVVEAVLPCVGHAWCHGIPRLRLLIGNGLDSLESVLMGFLHEVMVGFRWFGWVCILTLRLESAFDNREVC